MEKIFYRVWRNRDGEVITEKVREAEERYYGEKSFLDPERYATYEQADIARLHYVLAHSGYRDNMHRISDQDKQTLLQLLEEKLAVLRS